jgi:signal transduction histidine kinase
MSLRTVKPTILVVDDEPDMLMSVRDLLRKDYHLITTASAVEALKILQHDSSIRVILTDQRMPEMSGVALLREAKWIRPEVTRLLFTAYSDIAAVIAAINEGNVFRYIDKPWNPDEMLSVVKQATEQYALISENRRLVQDLSEKNQQLLQAGRLKGAFLEIASHELNTPVAVVLGLTELWRLTQSADASPAARSWVDRIHNAGKRLAITVERMFKLIRTDQPTLALERQKVDLELLVRKVVSDLMPFVENREQSIELTIAPDLGVAEADPNKLSDILTNLISNAIKFSPDGSVIGLIAETDGSDWVRFAIVDRGNGIRPEDRTHLFEPFFTGYDTMHHSSGEYQFGKRGIGLGLCLVKTFVELHGGQVNLESNVGSGSRFGFSIPRSGRVSLTQRPLSENIEQMSVPACPEK